MMSPKDLYNYLERINNEYQAEQTYEQDKDDPSEGTPWHPDYGKEKNDLKVKDIPF